LSDARTPTAHATSHLPGGSDALTTAAPSQGIGGSNGVGTAASFARSDHDHTIRETGGPTNLTVGAIADGQTVKRSGTALVGVSGGSGTVWHADVPPSSPSAQDDEFNGSNGSSLSGIWGDWNPGATTTAYSINGRGALEVTQTTHTGTQVEGKRQATPVSGIFAFASKLTFITPTPQATWKAGIFVAGDIVTNPTTAPLVFFNLEPSTIATAMLVAVQHQTSYTASPTTDASMSIGGNGSGGGYLRMRVNGTAVKCDFGWAINGEVVWIQVASITASFGPAYCGIAVDNANTTASDQISYFHFFRMLAVGTGSDAMNATYLGGFL
jgi:hypothetical protein